MPVIPWEHEVGVARLQSLLMSCGARRIRRFARYRREDRSAHSPSCGWCVCVWIGRACRGLARRHIFGVRFARNCGFTCSYLGGDACPVYPPYAGSSRVKFIDNELPTDGYSHVSIVSTRTNKLTNASQFYTMCTAPRPLSAKGNRSCRKARFLFHCCHRPRPRIELYLKRLEPSRTNAHILGTCFV